MFYKFGTAGTSLRRAQSSRPTKWTAEQWQQKRSFSYLRRARRLGSPPHSNPQTVRRGAPKAKGGHGSPPLHIAGDCRLFLQRYFPERLRVLKPKHLTLTYILGFPCIEYRFNLFKIEKSFCFAVDGVIIIFDQSPLSCAVMNILCGIDSA